MRQNTTFLFFLLTLSVGVLGLLPESLKKDIFNLHKGLAVETKNIIKSNVTRDKIVLSMFRNDPQPKEATITDDNLHLLENTKGKVVFITHGWASEASAEWVLDLKSAFLTTYPDYVVITVDWKGPANQLYYISSINTFDVGNIIGDTIINLVENHNIDISKFILVGHSLGAQTSGFAGKRIQKAGKKLHRIVALDPAGPLFDVRPVSKRLNPTDAEVVEVIHSDGHTFGFKDSCGTIDFYPNGGDFQPGCTRVDILDVTSVGEPVMCDHQRSYQYFIDAVLHPKDYLVAIHCSQYSILRKKCDENDTVAMGDLTTTKTGNFYLDTNRERPYGKQVIKKVAGILDKVSGAGSKVTNVLGRIV